MIKINPLGKFAFLDIDGVLVVDDERFNVYGRYYDIDVSLPSAKNMSLGEFEYHYLLRNKKIYDAKKSSQLPLINYEKEVIFDKNALSYIRKLYEKTDCQFVLSSDWRIGKSLEEISRLMIKKGLQVPFYSKTRDGTDTMYPDDRYSQIYHWNKENKINNYIVIDDVCFRGFERFEEKFIQTNPISGFSQENLEQAIKQLNK